MIKRILGNHGPEVSSIGLGCMGLSNRSLRKGESLNVLKAAYEQGVTFFDTAPTYGPHTNEELLGEAFRSCRDRVIMVTKFGVKIEGGRQIHDSSELQIRKSIEGSLKRLRTDYIDLFIQHRVDLNTPIEEVARVIGDLMREGKVRYWGLSEAGVKTIKRAHRVCPVTAVESEYSLWWRSPEEELISVLETLGIGMIPFCPLGRGFLTGTILANAKFPASDIRSTIPRFKSENLRVNLKLIALIKEVASVKHATPAQIALSWLLAKKSWIVPIPGTSSLHRLEENIGSLDVVLTPEDVTDLEKRIEKIAIQGNRYPDDLEKGTGL